jgi:Starch-binding associating with outer membrane
MQKYILAISLFFFLALPSCQKGFEDLNQNPFKPTQTEIGPLFNGVMESLTLGWSEQLYLHNEIIYKLTQQAALTSTTFQNPSIGTEEVWSKYYLPLANIRDIESRIEAYEGDPEAMNNVRAMLKTLLAFKTFKVTDLFGDIPFFEAGKGFEGTEKVRPPFDSQESIYKFLLEELKWVNDNANTNPAPMTASGEPYVSLNGFDHLFEEDMVKWVKFANSLRLRHAMRMVEKDPDYATPIIQDILENDLPVVQKGEDVVLVPRRFDWKKQSTHWSFREHRKLRMGSNIWRHLSTSDAIDGSGIFDPRARIFFETNNANEWAAFPQIPDANTPPSGGAPYDGVRDVAYTLKGMDNIYSPFNYYLIRDEDDIPEILLTAAEVEFIKAEAYLRGLGVAADEDEAQIAYESGISSSIIFWHAVANGTAIWVNNNPTLAPNGEYATINHPNVFFSNATDKLQLIYTQRWIDAFRQPWEAYALSRRTQATPIEGVRETHYRFPYPPSEAENNPENWSAQVAKIGEDSERVKVWWME